MGCAVRSAFFWTAVAAGWWVEVCTWEMCEIIRSERVSYRDFCHDVVWSVLFCFAGKTCFLVIG